MHPFCCAKSQAPPPGLQFLAQHSPSHLPSFQLARTPCSLLPNHWLLPFATCAPRELGTQALPADYVVQEMHFKLVPGYSDPGIRHYLLWGGDGNMCGDRPSNAGVEITLYSRDHSRSGRLPVVQGAGEKWDWGTFTPGYVRVTRLSFNIRGEDMFSEAIAPPPPTPSSYIWSQTVCKEKDGLS